MRIRRIPASVNRPSSSMPREFRRGQGAKGRRGSHNDEEHPDGSNERNTFDSDRHRPTVTGLQAHTPTTGRRRCPSTPSPVGHRSIRHSDGLLRIRHGDRLADRLDHSRDGFPEARDDLGPLFPCVRIDDVHSGIGGGRLGDVDGISQPVPHVDRDQHFTVRQSSISRQLSRLVGALTMRSPAILRTAARTSRDGEPLPAPCAAGTTQFRHVTKLATRRTSVEDQSVGCPGAPLWTGSQAPHRHLLVVMST